MKGTGTFVSSTATAHDRVLKQTTKVMAGINQTVKRVGGGTKFESFAEMDPAELRYSQGIKNEILYLESQVNRNKTFTTELEEYENHIQSIIQVIEEAKQFVGQALNPMQTDLLPLTSVSDQFMLGFEGFMEKTFQSSKMFSGSKTNTDTVGNVVQISNIAANDVITSNYYQGNEIRPQHLISQNQTVDYRITGNDRAFQEFFAAFNFVKRYEQTKQIEDIRTAFSYLDSAGKEFQNKIAVIGVYLGTTKRTIANDEATVQNLKEIKSALTDADEVETINKFMQQQVQLQASYTVISSLKDMFIGPFIL